MLITPDTAVNGRYQAVLLTASHINLSFVCRHIFVTLRPYGEMKLFIICYFLLLYPSCSCKSPYMVVVVHHHMYTSTNNGR